MMNNKLLLALATVLIPGTVYALGVGRIEVYSALNEPFSARIPLIAASAQELDSLNVGLAGIDAFRNAGIDRPFVLSQLRFEVVEEEKGGDYIRVTSREPIREPFLNFLLELNWASGRLFREFTVLLDPPAYEQPRRVTAPVTAAAPAPDPAPPKYTHTVNYPDQQPARAPASIAAAVPYTGGDYGPTQSGDTLWSIALRMRPAESISNQQMMLALLRTNPDAFIGGNVNGLKKGVILRMPDQSELDALSRAEAMAEVRRQYSAWEEARAAAVTAPPVQPAGPAQAEIAKPPAAAPPPPVEDEPELRVLEATGEGEGAQQVTAAPGVATGDVGNLRKELAIAAESLEASKQEVAELKSKLAENEQIIEDLKRLIALKDDELASLQEQMRNQAAKAAMPVTEPAPPLAEGKPEALAPQPTEPETKPEPPPAKEPAPVVAEKPAKAEAPPPASAAPGLVDTALGYVGGARDFIMANSTMVGLGIGAIALALLGLVYTRRRAQPAAAMAGADFPDFAAVPAGETTDFETAEAVTEVPEPESEAVTELPAAAPAPAAQEADERTLFVVPETRPPAPAAAAIEAPPEEDPLAEVNVLMAYEHFDQAEEFVRNAIAKQPKNLDFHTKLLEVFYAANNKKKFEEEARVLHDLTGGQGEQWETALLYWNEMSPTRALFAAPAAGEEEEAPKPAKGPGIVDITGQTAGAAAAATATRLDLDIGGGAEVLDLSAAPSTGEEEAVLEAALDLTAGEKVEGEGVLDLTAAESMEEATADEAKSEELAPLEFGNDAVLDITGGTETAAAEELPALEFSVGLEQEAKTEEAGLDLAVGEDLLDVTQEIQLEPEPGEDLLDVTATGKKAVGAEIDLDLAPGEAVEEALPDLDLELKKAGEAEAPAAEAADKALEFEGGLDFAVEGEVEAEKPGEGTVDLELPAMEDGRGGMESVEGLAVELENLDVSLGAEEKKLSDTAEAMQGIDQALNELDATLEAGVGKEAGGLDFDLDMGADEAAEPKAEPKIAEAEAGLDFELDIGTEEGPALSLEDELKLDEGAPAEPAAAEPAADFSLDLEIEQPETPAPPEVKSVGPGILLELADEEDEGDRTVFVPRSAKVDEQSLEDEVTTKLDLAKAYVELGDADSARTILDEVLKEGNPAQKKQAQELLKQITG